MTTNLIFLQRLDVGEDADDRAIRRAYARELKLIDQQTDPAGFQLLREAYDCALDWQRHRAAQAPGTQADEAPAPATENAAPPSDGGQPAGAFPASEPAAAADERREPEPRAQEDQHAAATAVFEEFLRRGAALIDARAISSDAPWRHALSVCLDDARLINIVARDLFEQHVADLLAHGWRPGHDVLLEAAVKVFGWHSDRRRVRALGYAGFVLDSAIDERAMFDALEDRDQQRQLIERLRDPRAPGARELLADTASMGMLFSRFPTWMPLITSAENLQRWQVAERALPGWKRLLHRAGPRSGGARRWTVNWKWLIFVAVLSLTRMACHDWNRDDDARRRAQATGQPASGAHENVADILAKADNLLTERDYGAAIAGYTRVIQLDPRSSAAYSNRALASLFTGADDASIVADLERAAELEQTNANVPRARGMLAMRKGLYQDAIAEFTRAQALYPDHPYTLDKRAEAYERAGQLELALADIDRRLRVAPDASVEVYRLRIKILTKQGNEADAFAQIEPMIGANKNNAEAYFVAATVYRNAGQDRQAMFMLDRGIAEAPDSTLYLARARMRERADLAGRRADLDKCRTVPSCASYEDEQRIELELDDGKPEVALKLLSAQIEGDKVSYANQPAMLAYRAIVYTKMGQTSLAKAGFDAARGAAGTREALNNLAWFLATKNVELPRALAAIDAALVKQAPIPAHLDTKGLVLLRMGRYREAVAAYDAVLALRPNQAFSQYGRGLAKRLAGDKAGGDADLKAARLEAPAIGAEFDRFGLRP